jgi:hypothetical protein
LATICFTPSRAWSCFASQTSGFLAVNTQCASPSSGVNTQRRRRNTGSAQGLPARGVSYRAVIPRKRMRANITSAMRCLALRTQGFRHGRPCCAGHPRRGAHSGFDFIAPSGADKRVGFLSLPWPLTAWMPGHDENSDDQSPKTADGPLASAPCPPRGRRPAWDRRQERRRSAVSGSGRDCGLYSRSPL